MLNDLKNLKQIGARAVKIEFESEYLPDEELIEFSRLVHSADLELCIKLGGATSIRDVYLSKMFQADSIVAPMVESSYAVKKFLDNLKNVYEGLMLPEILINIETKNAFENLDEILEMSDAISGFVIGRSDLKSSLEIENPNDDVILNYCEKLSKICAQRKKKLVIGGKINAESIDFLDKLSYFSEFETRKVIFNSASLDQKSIESALSFELSYLNSKKIQYKEDLSRMEFIKKSLQVYSKL